MDNPISPPPRPVMISLDSGGDLVLQCLDIGPSIEMSLNRAVKRGECKLPRPEGRGFL